MFNTFITLTLFFLFLSFVASLCLCSLLISAISGSLRRYASNTNHINSIYVTTSSNITNKYKFNLINSELNTTYTIPVINSNMKLIAPKVYVHNIMNDKVAYKEV